MPKAPSARVLSAVFGLCLVVIGCAFVWGRQFERREPRIKLGAAPFVGAWDPRLALSMMPAVVVGCAAVFLLPKVFRVLSDTWSIVVTSLTGALFALVLAGADGLDVILAPVVDPTEYWANLEFLPKAADLLLLHSNYEFLVDRSVHMKGHPPGFVLLLKGLAAIGLEAPWIVGALSFLGVGLIASAVGMTVRCLTDGVVLRSVLPFVALAPFAVWLGTSADAFFSGIAGWGIAAATMAVRSARLRTRLLLGAASGLCLASALFLTYGAATIVLLAAVLVLTGIRKRLVNTIQAGGAAVLAAGLVTGIFHHFGFWWFDGLRLTNKFYWIGSAYFRTWTYFLLGNVAVLLIAIGPAVIAGIVSLRDRKLWPVVGGALLCILAAELSQYSKGEVERIWLLFMPWLVPAVASIVSDAAGPTSSPGRTVLFTDRQAGSDAPVRPGVNGVVAFGSSDGSSSTATTKWLACQVALALVLQATLRSKW
jgi:methylthioxylose transferase